MESVGVIDYEISKYLDGLIIVSDDWRVVKINSTSYGNQFNLSYQLSPSRIYPQTFKGVELDFGNVIYHKVKLGYTYQLGYSTIFHLVFGFKQLQNKEALRKITVHLRQIVAKLGSKCDKNTKEDFYVKIARRRYEDMQISPTVFQKFGAALFKEAEAYLRLIGDLVYYKSIICNLGENESFHRLNSFLEKLDLCQCEALVIHHATNFSIVNYTCFWDRKTLQKLFGAKNMTQEYYPAFVKGCGNFNFKSNVQLPIHGIEIVEKKFYSTLFRRIVKSEDWLISNAANELFLPIERTAGFLDRYPLNLEKFQTMCEQFREELDSTRGRNATNCGRHELVLLIKTPANIAKTHKVGKDFAGFIDTRIGGSELKHRLVHQSLRKIPTTCIHQHIYNHVMPFISFLEVQLQRKMNALKDGCEYNLSIDDYLKCVAAQAISTFAVYGNCTYRKGKHISPEWINKSLGLMKANFRSGPWDAGSWTLLGVLNTDKSFKPSEGFLAKVVTEICKLRKCNLKLEEFITRFQIVLLDLKGGVQNDCDTLSNFCIESNLPFEIILTSALNFDTNRRHKFSKRSVGNLFRKYCESNDPREFKSPKQFVEYIFTLMNTGEGHAFLGWFINILKYMMCGTCAESILKKAICAVVKKNICKDGALIFPIFQKSRKFQFWVTIEKRLDATTGTLKRYKQKALLFNF